MAEYRTEHNIETGEITQIELTAEEIKEMTKIRAAATKVQADADKAKAKADADKAALLDRLGLTENELKIILG
jgi:hypothetical protein